MNVEPVLFTTKNTFCIPVKVVAPLVEVLMSRNIYEFAVGEVKRLIEKRLCVLAFVSAELSVVKLLPTWNTKAEVPALVTLVTFIENW